MNESNIWKREPKRMGVITPAATYRFPKPYQRALAVLAARESRRTGSSISQATIIMNLTMEGSNEYRPKQSELKTIYLQLNKENQNAKQQKTITGAATLGDRTPRESTS